MNSRALSRALALTTALASAAIITSCADHPPTAITLAVSSEAAIPKEIDTISIRVLRSGSTQFAETYKVDPKSGTVKLPGTIAVKPQKDQSASDPVRIELYASVSGKQVVLRTATLGFQEEHQKLLRLPLRYSCYELPEVCGDGSTCIGGRCVTDAIDVTSLPEDNGATIFPVATQGGCFDPSNTACGAGRVHVADLPGLAASGCRLDTQDARAKDKLNVFVVWASSDGTTPTALDASPDEGFSLVAGSSTAVQLAPGICDAITSGRILSVEYGFACPTKVLAVPECVTDEATQKTPTFDQSACHQCVYQPTECDAARAAITGTQSTWVQDAFACTYDGYYDSAVECSAVRGCFLGQLSGYLNCQGAACDDPALSAISSWVTCLDSVDRITQCKSVCDAEGASICPSGI